MMESTAQHFLESGELFKSYCASHLKYHLEESDSYQDMCTFRE